MKPRNHKKQQNRHRRSSKSNRVWDETVHTWALPLRAAVLITIGVMATVVYAIMTNSRASLLNEIAQQESRQEELLDNLQREKTRWLSMKTPNNLESKLLKHGIEMSLPRTNQRVAILNSTATANYREPIYTARR